MGYNINDNGEIIRPNEAPPKNYLTESILTTIFCCLPFGVAGIVNASKVNSLYKIGDYQGAIEASEKAKKWTLWSFWFGVVIVVINILVAIAES